MDVDIAGVWAHASIGVSDLMFWLLLVYGPVFLGIPALCVIAYRAGRGSRWATGLLGVIGAGVTIYILTNRVGYRNRGVFAPVACLAWVSHHFGQRRRARAANSDEG